MYYQPGEHQDVSRSSEGQRKPLTSLLVPSTEVVTKRRGNTLKVKYVEVGDTDKHTGQIVNSKELEIQNLPSRAKWVVRQNMLLIPNHRNSIKSGRSVTLVPPEHDGVVVTSRFIVARTTVPAIYLYHILNLDIVKQRMLTLVSGSLSTEIKFDQLSEIQVPLPDDDDFDLWVENINALTDEISESRSSLRQKEKELQSFINNLYN